MQAKQISFFKYQGAGNDFIMLDNRTNKYSYLTTSDIAQLCKRHFGIGADGLIMIESNNRDNFYMRYFNSDGSESTMCGNGGRCVALFAHHLGLFDNITTFLAIDGEHKAELLANEQIKLKMSDCAPPLKIDKNMFTINTGSPHLVVLVDDIDMINVKSDGRELSHDTKISNDGINVNFCQIVENRIIIRTYERGVEDETLACGTGSVASSIVSYCGGLIKHQKNIMVQTLGGLLTVSFDHSNIIRNVYLTGSAKKVFDGSIEIV